jgi:hypothetical protein
MVLSAFQDRLIMLAQPSKVAGVIFDAALKARAN